MRKSTQRKGAITALSAQARERIGTELAELRQRRDRLFHDLEGTSDVMGEPGDAADGIQAAEHLAFVNRRIAELEDLLQRPPSDSQPSALLPYGTEVTLRFSDGETVTMRVVSVVEEIALDTDDEALTTDSPLGLALVGRHPGESVTYLAPRGEQHVELVAMRLPDQPRTPDQPGGTG
jgi:transcription elongation factor GreA